MLANGKCELTGEDGILDLEAGGRCACVSPMMGVFCNGNPKSRSLSEQQLQDNFIKCKALEDKRRGVSGVI